MSLVEEWQKCSDKERAEIRTRMAIRHLKSVQIGCFPSTASGKEYLAIHAEKLRKAYGK